MNGTADTLTESATVENARPPKQTRPSCKLCKHHKIKCDRLDPCSHCAKVNASCEYQPPSKLPRGRKGGRKKNQTLLLNRLNHLESLIQDIEAGNVPTAAANGVPSQPSTVYDPNPSRAAKAVRDPPDSGKGLSKYLSSSVWLSLGDSVR